MPQGITLVTQSNRHAKHSVISISFAYEYAVQFNTDNFNIETLIWKKITYHIKSVVEHLEYDFLAFQVL